MDILEGLLSGFSVVFEPLNLLFVTLGVLLGTVLGLLPGLGPTASIALLLPLTFAMDPAPAIIMLAGIYYGSMYGGRIPAILLNLPGDASSVLTTLDGYPLAQQGRAGSALGITAIGSFIGGTIAIVGLTFFAPVIAQFAGGIGAPELFSLTLFGLLMIVFIGSGSLLKSLAIAALGMLVATVGMDPIDATQRLTFDNLDLAAGINIVPVAVGLFGIGEILYNAERGYRAEPAGGSVSNVLPTWADWVQTRVAILRASVVGFFIGVLPGGGGAVSSVISYGAQKRFSKNPDQFGKGAIDGLAATETADNSSSNSAFIPLLTLGVPPNPVLALIFGALLLQNITPGPQLINEHPDIFYGVIASMYIGNLILLILNLPLIRVFVLLLRIPGGVLAPVIVVIAACGVYSVANSFTDVWVALVFGVFGYLLKKWRFDLAPFILAFILGPILELQFRRSMLVSDGDFSIFVERPVSALALVVLVLVVCYSLFRRVRRVSSTADQGTA